MAGELMAGSKTPLKSIAVNQFGVSRFLGRLFDHRSDGPLLFLGGSCFSLNSSAGPRIPVPGCAALGPAWARHGRFVPLGVSNLGRQGAEGAASPRCVGRRWSPARAHFEGSVSSTEAPKCPELLRYL